MFTRLVGHNHVERVFIVIAVNFEAVVDHGHIPAEKVNKHALSFFEHRLEGAVLKRARYAALNDNHQACSSPKPRGQASLRSRAGRYTRNGGYSAAQDIEKTYVTVEQSVDGKQRSLANTITVPCMTQVLRNGLFADAEDHGNFPIGLSTRRPDDAFALPFRELDGLPRNPFPSHPPCCLKGESAR